MPDRFDADFLQKLHRSIVDVGLVSAWISANYRDYVTVLMPTVKRPSYEERMDYVDSGDLYMVKKADADPLLKNGDKIEVKHVRIKFTCREDFPFKETMICAVHSFNEEEPAKGYIRVNESFSHAIVVNVAKTRQHWTIKTMPDNTRSGQKQDVFMCDIGLCDFIKLK